MFDSSLVPRENALVPRENALYQAVTHGTGFDVAIPLSLSFAGGDKDESDSYESDEGDIRTYDMNEEDSQSIRHVVGCCWCVGREL